MILFCDSSAVVPLLVTEPHSDLAGKALSAAKGLVAWRWLAVEVEATLARRRAPAAAWQRWRSLEAGFRFLDLEPAACQALNAFNRGLRLRSADAGHLFLFDRASSVISGLTLLTFNGEMLAAADDLSMLVWRPSATGP